MFPLAFNNIVVQHFAQDDGNDTECGLSLFISTRDCNVRISVTWYKLPADV